MSPKEQKTFTVENYVGKKILERRLKDLKSTYNIPEKLIKIVEEESSDVEEGVVIQPKPQLQALLMNSDVK